MPPKSVTTNKVNKRNQKLLPPADPEILSQDDTTGTCDAILVTRSEIGSEEEMKKDAKAALGQALQEEELHVEDVREEQVFVGNICGLSFASLPERVRALEQYGPCVHFEAFYAGV